jgi:hypothetical protein
MNKSQFLMKFQHSVIALVLVGIGPSSALAQSGHSHMSMTDQHAMTAGEQSNAATLIKAIREATERFKDPAVAEAEGYALQFGCVTGPDFGAMGLHYVNGALVASGVIDPKHPQIVIYEPTADGGVRLIGADFLVLADAWNATHAHAPELMGQLFQFFDAPNRFGLPPFYTLHVWAWKENPNGAFVNWHPKVSCAAFSGPTQ